jgi:hypothetical protein
LPNQENHSHARQTLSFSFLIHFFFLFSSYHVQLKIIFVLFQPGKTVGNLFNSRKKNKKFAAKLIQSKKNVRQNVFAGPKQQSAGDVINPMSTHTHTRKNAEKKKKQLVSFDLYSHVVVPKAAKFQRRRRRLDKV